MLTHRYTWIVLFSKETILKRQVRGIGNDADA